MKGLLDKKRFVAWEKEKIRWLKNLSLSQAMRIQEGLLSSELIWLWRKNFFKDKPVCLKDILRKKT